MHCIWRTILLRRIYRHNIPRLRYSTASNLVVDTDRSILQYNPGLKNHERRTKLLTRTYWIAILFLCTTVYNNIITVLLHMILILFYLQTTIKYYELLFHVAIFLYLVTLIKSITLWHLNGSNIQYVSHHTSFHGTNRRSPVTSKQPIVKRVRYHMITKISQ